ncbi:aldo/keto reductase [Sulfurimonas sp. HSL3-7]|uniref:aldo/keto reductase family protein n=1 Tax=Sulfonitrofixus jiaomeiensis TaxID=3131938 RepID=UPI0031F923D2
MQENRYVMTTAGVTMPSLIYGTAWKKERTAELVVEAVQAGFRGIDTACQPKHYHEAGVGDALTTLRKQGIKREELYVQTKFTPVAGQDAGTIPYDREAPLAEQVAQSFAASQKNLQSDYVDALLLHTPLFPFSHLLSVWRAMEKIQKSGGARQLGISNCDDLALLKRLYSEARVKPVLVQNRFYDASGYDTELRRWCGEQGIIYQSFWSLTANPHLLGSEAVFTLARKYRKSEAQIFYAFLNAIGIVPLDGTTSLEHMAEDLDIFTFELLPSEIRTIEKLL